MITLLHEEQIETEDPVIIVEEDGKNYLKFYIEKDSDELGFEFKIADIDMFLNIVSTVLSGQVTETVLKFVFEAIDDDKIKEKFIDELLEVSEEKLRDTTKGQLVIKPSEFGMEDRT
jgi:hypothetical protein